MIQKSPAMARVLSIALSAGMVVFLSFQVGVYASRSLSDKALWGSDEASIVTSNNQFALNLFKGLRGNDDTNIFFSPFSISSALAMTMLGAKGRTAEQMFEVLLFSGSLAEMVIHGGFKTLLTELLSKEDDRYILHLANRVYMQEGYKVLESFRNATKKYYDAESQSVDFQGDTETAREMINIWVEDMTRDKIKELLKPGMLSSSTRMLLVNAIYFKGNWLHRFDPELTGEWTFHINENDTAPVQMMYRKEEFKNGFNEELNAQILELPYVGNELSMVLILPKEKTGLNSMQDKLTGDVTSLTKNLQTSDVIVSIPKFKMTSDFELGDLLQLMGMADLFTRSADLSGINREGGLHMGHVVHKAFIDVNEEGSEAAAATDLILLDADNMPIRFFADHPFFFFIKHEKTNSILFMGRYVQPEKSSMNDSYIRDEL